MSSELSSGTWGYSDATHHRLSQASQSVVRIQPGSRRRKQETEAKTPLFCVSLCMCPCLFLNILAWKRVTAVLVWFYLVLFDCTHVLLGAHTSLAVYAWSACAIVFTSSFAWGKSYAVYSNLLTWLLRSRKVKWLVQGHTASYRDTDDTETRISNL